MPDTSTDSKSLHWLNRYIDKRYKNKENKEVSYELIDVTNMNQEYDYIFRKEDIFSEVKDITIELKTRYFNDDNKIYLEHRDILIEAVQNQPYISKNYISMSSKQLHTSVGWFYKCNADRLIQITFLNNECYDIMDFDFKPFRSYLFDNMSICGSLNYSPKTTGTINYCVALKDIASKYYKLESNPKIQVDKKEGIFE